MTNVIVTHDNIDVDAWQCKCGATPETSTYWDNERGVATWVHYCHRCNGTPDESLYE